MRWPRAHQDHDLQSAPRGPHSAWHNAPARRFGKRLYLRIWLAVLLSLLAVGVLSVTAWRFYGSELPRDIVLSNEAGQRMGSARLVHQEKQAAVRVELDDGKVLYARWPPGDDRRGSGMRPPFGFAGWLLLIVLAVGLGAYPVVKRLTRRLEQLQQGVDALGQGNLAARVPVRGHDEIAWLAERFNLAAAQIETLVATHKSLLANASHELRSPLARIRMALEQLDGGGSAAARAEITRSIGELDALIEEILLASRLDAAGAPQEAFEEVDLTALAAEECARCDATLDADGVITLHGSARLLRRLVRNLLENARRHGGAARIDVSLRRAEADVSGNEARAGSAQRIELAVCDRGPGVPEAERERIFDAFYRLKGSSEAAGGAGLGLALVRAIAREHGGTAQCVARAGGGACFQVTLPA